MKNIHLISTDKPSRLIIYSTLVNEFRLLAEPIEDWKHKKHIYITSEKEAKDGDWCIVGNGVSKLNTQFTSKEEINTIWKKIILTTDQDLIADGVQAIDDTFLEWFVKNPSCEFVEVETYFKKIGVETDANGYRAMDVLGKDYKIIIPQDEPKTGSLLESIQEVNKDLLREINELKQETLEEAAEKYAVNKSSANVFQEAHKKDFINGAKWQSEKMYSEEDMIQFSAIAYLAMIDPTNNKSFEELLQTWLKQFKKKA
jgi:hypothetical protein